MRLPLRRLAPMVLAVCCAGHAAAAEVDSIPVFAAGEQGYHTFRIPVMVRAGNGDLLAFAEGRKNSRRDSGDIDIVLRRSSDDGASWDTIELVQDEWSDPEGEVTIGNPVPVVDRQDPSHPDRIWLVFCRNNNRVLVTYSDDHGSTWSRRRDITSTAKRSSWGWYASGPVHGIQLEQGEYAGRLIVPCDHRDEATGGWGAHILYSDDHGESWQVGAVDTHGKESPLHPNECVAVELADGRVYVNARDQHGSSPATRAIAYSTDGGQSFETRFAAEPSLVTPVVQNSVLPVSIDSPAGVRDALVHSGPGHATKRRDLTIRGSLDGGKSWNGGEVIDPGPTAYSDLVELDEGRIGVLYEAGDSLYDEILYATFALDGLLRSE